MTNTEIIARPDGSIDTAHYMARGRKLRSEQAHAMLSGLAKDTSDDGKIVILSTKRPSLFMRWAGLAT